MMLRILILLLAALGISMIIFTCTSISKSQEPLAKPFFPWRQKVHKELQGYRDILNNQLILQRVLKDKQDLDRAIKAVQELQKLIDDANKVQPLPKISVQPTPAGVTVTCPEITVDIK